MSNVSVSQSWVDDMERETQEMFRKLEHQAEQLRQKDEQIRELADALERTFEVALPGSIESQIRAALSLVGRKP